MFFSVSTLNLSQSEFVGVDVQIRSGRSARRRSRSDATAARHGSTEWRSGHEWGEE